MLDIVLTAAVTAFLTIAILGHLLLFTAIVYGVDGLPKGWLRKSKRDRMTPQSARAADAF